MAEYMDTPDKSKTELMQEIEDKFADRVCYFKHHILMSYRKTITQTCNPPASTNELRALSKKLESKTNFALDTIPCINRFEKWDKVYKQLPYSDITIHQIWKYIQTRTDFAEANKRELVKECKKIAMDAIQQELGASRIDSRITSDAIDHIMNNDTQENHLSTNEHDKIKLLTEQLQREKASCAIDILDEILVCLRDVISEYNIDSMPQADEFDQKQTLETKLQQVKNYLAFCEDIAGKYHSKEKEIIALKRKFEQKENELTAEISRFGGLATRLSNQLKLAEESQEKWNQELNKAQATNIEMKKMLQDAELRGAIAQSYLDDVLEMLPSHREASSPLLSSEDCLVQEMIHSGHFSTHLPPIHQGNSSAQQTSDMPNIVSAPNWRASSAHPRTQPH